jgi:hypothetical protein
MLQFLQGWLWLFAAAAALPVILHLLSRQRLRKIQFSSLMLLSRLEKSQMRRLRVRQLLLLILRTLAVLTLVFAFARPLLRETDTPLLGTQTAAVLIIDESASMSAMGSTGRRIDRARAVGRRIVATLGPGDRLAALPDTGGSAPPDFEYSHDGWNAQVDGFAVTDGQADLGAALAAARRALDTVSTGVREVYIVTDGQRSAWHTVPSREAADVHAYVVSVGEDLQPNRSVRHLDFGGSLWIANATADLQVTIVNAGPEIRDLPVSLFLDGNRVAQSAVTLARGDSGNVALRLPSLEAGWHHGRVQISADAWPTDNALYFALEAEANLPVLVVGQDDALVRPIRAALRPGPGARTPFQPQVVSAASLGNEIDPSIGLVVLAGTPVIAPSGWQRLLRFVEGGGGLLVFLGADSDRDNFSRYFTVPLWSAQLVGRTDSLPLSSFVTLDRPAPHPMFEFLDQSAAFPEIRFRGTARLTPVDATWVRQRFSDGSPAMLEATRGSGRAVLFAGFSAPRESDLVYHPIFVPVVQSVATYTARRGALRTEPYLHVGNRPDGIAKAVGEWTWTTPTGDTSTLPGGPITLPKLTKAGVYSLLESDTVVALFAANVPTEEQDLEPLSAWTDVLGTTSATELSPTGEIRDTITQARVGVDLWYPAIILALLFLLAEMLVAWPRKSELSTPAST